MRQMNETALQSLTAIYKYQVSFFACFEMCGTDVVYVLRTCYEMPGTDTS